MGISVAIEAVPIPTAKSLPNYFVELKFDEPSNAIRLLNLANGHLRYVQDWKSFIVYEGGVWHKDTGDVLAFDMAKGVSQYLYAMHAERTAQFNEDVSLGKVVFGEMEQIDAYLKALKAWAKTSSTAASIRAMLAQVRGMEGVLTQHNELDANGYLFNCANGTFDFTPVLDGKAPLFRAQDPNDLITMQSPVAYDPKAECPLWFDCLEKWQPDEEMEDYLQMRAGACALGINTETIDFDYGAGGNGKSKFHGAVEHVLGDYTCKPKKSLFIVQRFAEHQVIFASLFRKRMAVTSEIGENQTLDEESVKALTGNDTLEARFMRENPWTFKPSHTLIVHTNVMPKIKSTGAAIWGRVHLVPWDSLNIVRGSKEDNTELASQLEDESQGILNWIIRGAITYLKDGWFVPDAVRVSTETFREEQDTLGQFMKNMIVVTKNPSDVEYFYDIQEALKEWLEDKDMPQTNRVIKALSDAGAVREPKRVRYTVPSSYPMGMDRTVQTYRWTGLRLGPFDA